MLKMYYAKKVKLLLNIEGSFVNHVVSNLFALLMIVSLSLTALCGQIMEPSYAPFEQYQHTVSYVQAKNLIDNYLRLDAEFDNYISLAPDHLDIFTSPATKQANEPEFTLFFGTQSSPVEQKKLQLFNPEQPLAGLRIALDPGHLGGNMAQLEERFIDIPVQNGKSACTFNEGTLTAATACYLRDMLVSLGAEVMLTKGKPGQAVYEVSFNDWCKQTFDIHTEADWATAATQQKLISFLQSDAIPNIENRAARIAELVSLSSQAAATRLKQSLLRLCYNQLDLRARTAKINDWQPDLTLALHYNAHGPNSNYKTISANYNMTFIPGGIEGAALRNKTTRIALIRFLVTPIVEQSHVLSLCITQAMTEELGVKPLKTPYPNSRLVETGVYARNLALLRNTESPMCYAESLVQNNHDEAVRLSQKDDVIDGIIAPSRIKQVAKAYTNGICAYWEALNSNSVSPQS
ncbi:hypothetical protein FJ365_04985 [Candidatus Dependentiae bacterium]|nr:hypothetical protein [Candidatus Dependentiae bacterium]